MARPQTPTKIKDLRGSFIKHPERRPKAEPIPTGGIGPYPSDVPLSEEKIWDWLVSVSAPGVMTNMDRPALLALVKMVKKLFEGEINGSEFGQMVNLFGKFGFTPADRAKLGVSTKSPSKDGWEDF